MVDLLIGNLATYLAGAVAVLAALWGWGKKKERDGRLKERDRNAKRDAASAARVQEKIDANARDGDAVERLRDAGRLRE